MTYSEFTVKDQIKTDTTSSLSWMMSHSKRHIWSVIGMIIPSFANAALAAWVPVLIGAAFDVFVSTQSKPDYEHLLWSSTTVVLTQIARAVGILMRNISAEIIGQRMERDTRDE